MSIFDRIKAFIRPSPLSCRQINEFILTYLEGEMDDSTRVAFEAHLQNCPNCSAFLDQYRTTTQLVRDVDDIDVPPAVIERTIEFLRNRYEGGDE